MDDDKTDTSAGGEGDDHVDTFARISRYMKAAHTHADLWPIYLIGDDRLKVIFSNGTRFDVYPAPTMQESAQWGGVRKDKGVVDLYIRDGLAAMAMDWQQATSEMIRWSVFLALEVWGPLTRKRIESGLDLVGDAGQVEDDLQALADQSVISRPDGVDTYSTAPGRKARLTQAGRRAVRNRAERYAHRSPPAPATEDREDDDADTE